MGARMRAYDWTSTTLGSPANWPQSLKTIVRVMLDSRYAMWMLWGPELTFFCNDAYLPTVGLKGDWVLGARSDKVWEEIWPDIGPRIRQVLEQGEATWDEGLLLFLERRGFAEETYHTFSYSPVYDDESHIAGMLCVVTEVSERVIAERRLKALRDLAARARGVESVTEACQRLNEVLAGYPLDLPFAALYLLDEEQVEVTLAASTRALPESVLPAKARIHSHGLLPFAQAIASETAQHLDNLPAAGVAISAGPWPDWVKELLILPLKSSGHEKLAGLLVAGVSPRRQLDEDYHTFLGLAAGQIASALGDAQAFEAAELRAEALAELDRAKTTFFSNVSHEFRTPLTLMLGPVEETIADPAVPAAARERLQLAHRNSMRLLKLVNSLLDFSRIEAGRVQASFAPIALDVFTRDLASTFRSAMERAGLDFTVECADLGEPVYIDRDMWEKIVLNLLSNAFKFTLQGSVAVRLRRVGSDAVLEVQDSGAGISEEDLPRLFERFHRIEGTPGRSQEGSGIGLALVQELVKLHGATIDVTSAVGQGTTFSVHVPFGTAHLPKERVKVAAPPTSTAIGSQAFVQEALRWLPEEAAPDLGQSPAIADEISSRDSRFASTFGARIVLADDNADMRHYVRSLLEPHYAIETVEDGAQALAAAHAQRPDLILSDVMMPVLDGFGLLSALRNTQSLHDVPIVFLSARAGEEARIEGLSAGADDYVVKPFSARELLARVGSLLELTRLRRASESALREADRQKDQFLAMLAHELRNPLASIGNASELLSRLVTPEHDALPALALLKRQTRQLTRLVDDLMDISRIARGRVALEEKPLDIGMVIDQAVETVQPIMREKGHHLVMTRPQASLHVRGDLARLTQSLANVLHNAAKYTDGGGEIRLVVRDSPQEIAIEVSDNGAGISPELLPHVFDLFVQSERTLDRSQGGLGIGLSVVRRLIEMHGGSVAASSGGIGNGAVFTIRLPRIDSPPALQGALASAPAAQHRILVVDDNIDAADSLSMLLSLDGHEVHTAYGAAEALEAAARLTPEIIFLDIGLPQMNGYEVARQVRNMNALKNVRMIALTGYGQPEDRERSRKAGFDDHIVKPVTPEALELHFTVDQRFSTLD